MGSSVNELKHTRHIQEVVMERVLQLTLLHCLEQGVVIPIGVVVTAATGVEKRSRAQGLFLVSVKDNFQTW